MALESMDLKRAEFATKKVLAQNNAEYKNSVKKMLPLVQSSGLIAALAFSKAKGEKMGEVYNDVIEWLKKEDHFRENANEPLAELVTYDSQKILRITKETIAFLGWMKRMADESKSSESVHKVLVWCNNPDVEKRLLQFSSHTITNMGLEYDTFFVKDRGQWKVKKEYKELLDTINKFHFYYAQYRTQNDKHLITELIPMTYRLPSDTRELLERDKDSCDNYSLWLNKAGYWHDKKFQFIVNKQEKRKFDYNKVGDLISAVSKKQNAFLKDMDLKLTEVELSVSWRMVTGLGNESVYETGITLHPIFGFPYIPSSGVKGVVRSWIITEVFNKSEEDALKSDLFCYLFGSDKRSRNKEAKKGSIYFYDAYPVSSITIEPDVMTPHYGDYYTDSDSKTPPADYLSPNPIIFLTVKDTKFKFYVGSSLQTGEKKLSDFSNEGDTLVTVSLKEEFKSRLDINDKNDKTDLLTFINRWLTDALKHRGIGAKTSVGYGRMK